MKVVFHGKQLIILLLLLVYFYKFKEDKILLIGLLKISDCNIFYRRKNTECNFKYQDDFRAVYGGKIPNYYTLMHSGNNPLSSSQVIVWHWSTEGDLLQISILSSDTAFIEIFSSIFPLMEMFLPLREAMKKLLTVCHVKYLYHSIVYEKVLYTT